MTTSGVSWNNDPFAGSEVELDALDPRPATNQADEAYEAFFRRTYADTVRSLVRTGVDPESAADCAQEAYVKAYTRWWRIRRYDDPASWVRRVATNKAIDLHRKSGRHDKSLSTLAAGAVVTSPAPAEPDQMQELSALLPEQQRRVIELCYGKDLTAEQAAAEMGISAGAVRFHLSRARDRLRPAIDATRRGEEVV
jgi:RNA polymerase sigma-70 factor, ECF subfamily